MKSHKIDQIDQQIAQLKARRAAEMARIKSKKKKEETRRKILAGAFVLEEAEKNGTMSEFLKKLDRFLTRPNDRALFNFDDTKATDSNSTDVPSSPDNFSGQSV